MASPKFWPHHERAIDRLVEWAKDQSEVQAVLIGGSLAKGWGSESSDVDAVFVIDDQDFNRRVEIVDLTFNSPEIADYPGGYIDAKYYGRSFLYEIAEKGSEPMRASFLGTRIPYHRGEDLTPVISQITTYPTKDLEKRLQQYYAQLLAMDWYVEEAEKRQDPYLLNWSAQRAVLMAGRMALARNHIFFPFHKWLRQAVSEASDRPANLNELMDQTMTAPSAQNVHRLTEAIKNHRGWPPMTEEWWKDYILDTEWAWRSGRAPLDEA